VTDKQFRFARTSQCYCLGQRENACSKMNCTQVNTSLGSMRERTSILRLSIEAIDYVSPNAWGFQCLLRLNQGNVWSSYILDGAELP